MKLYRKNPVTRILERGITLMAHNWQNTCSCHKIDREKAVGLKSCNYALKITMFVNM